MANLRGQKVHGLTQGHWWWYGDYTGDDCPKCGRQRLMLCEDDDDRERVICEKCSWEPTANDYCYEALEK